MTTSPGWHPPSRLPVTVPGWAAPPSDLPLHVSVGDMDLSTRHGEADTAPWSLTMASWEGWEASAAPDESVTPHKSGDGQVIGVPRLSPRQVTLSGLIRATQPWGHGSLSEALSELSRIRWSTLRVSERGLQDREADVRVLRLQTTRVAERLARYTWSLVADDPLRHGSGEMLLGVGANVVPNRGNVQAWPRIHIKSTSAGNPTVIQVDAPGGTFRVSVPDGEYLVDTRDGVVWDVIGQRVHGVASGPWPYVLPGGSTWTINALTGMSQVRISRFEAWS